MTLRWGAGHVAAFLLMAVVLGAVSVILTLTAMTRVAIEDASREGQTITQTLLPQIAEAAQEGQDPVAALQNDRRIALILQAVTGLRSAVVFAAICDSSGTAVAHSLPEMIGTRLETFPALPNITGLRESARLLRSLSRPPAFYELRTPLRLEDRPFVTIRVGYAGGLIREKVAMVLKTSLVAGLAQIGIASLLGFFLSRLLTRRIRELSDGIAAMRAGRFESRIPETGVDEFSRLAHDLNLLAAQVQREQTDRDLRIEPIYETVEHLGKGIVALGADREVLLINSPAARILDLDPHIARGRKIDEILPTDHPVRELVARAYNGADGSVSLDIPQVKPNEPATAAVAHQIGGLGDRHRGVLIEFREAAAWKELRLLVSQSRVLSGLGQMAVGVSHEIGNSLQAINFELGALRENRDLSREEVATRVEAVASRVERIERAVSGYLKVARLRQPAYAPVQLNELLEQLSQSLEVEANLAGLELDLDLDEALPETLCDREVLLQAIQNLCKNAVQALPSTSRRVVLSSRLMDGIIRISVADTGPGIREEDLEKVCQLGFSTKRGGSGVGLSLVRQAIEMHGGELIIDSALGRGTTMTLCIPVRGEGDRRA